MPTAVCPRELGFCINPCEPWAAYSRKRHFFGVFVPALPVTGFRFPFVDQLSFCVLLGALRWWAWTCVPRFVV